MSGPKRLDPLESGSCHTYSREGALRAVPVLRVAPAAADVQGPQELAGSTVAQLVNRGLDLGFLTIFLPGVVGHAVLQWERTSPVARITTEDRTRGDVALFEVTPE